MTSPAEQLPLFAAEPPAHRLAADAVRLLLFNTQHASADRSRRQAAWIAGHDHGDIAACWRCSESDDVMTGRARSAAPSPSLPAVDEGGPANSPCRGPPGTTSALHVRRYSPHPANHQRNTRA